MLCRSKSQIRLKWRTSGTMFITRTSNGGEATLGGDPQKYIQVLIRTWEAFETKHLLQLKKSS
jgi:hypothetical protein